MIVLGSFIFSGFEVPEKLPLPSRQKLAVHKNIGGKRTVDAMGPDSEDIKWSGRFRGPGAMARALQLKAMCDAGGMVELYWADYFAQVVISAFDPTFEKPFEVTYSITCTVVDDGSASIGGLVGDFAALVGGDLDSASYIGAFAPLAAFSALAGLSAAVLAVPSLSGASVQAVNALTVTAGTTFIALNSLAVGYDANIQSSPVAGSDPANTASWLSAQALAVQAQSATLDMAGYVGRIGVNMAVKAA